jgi:hypothetical protein
MPRVPHQQHDMTGDEGSPEDEAQEAVWAEGTAQPLPQKRRVKKRVPFVPFAGECQKLPQSTIK